jgi:uncharacterized protein YeaO (DUF488 family)
MMQFYTSYYGNYKNIPSDYMCVGISRICPFKNWNIDNALPNFVFYKHNIFAPSKDLLDGFKEGKYDENDYKRIYVTQIYNWLNENNMTIKTWCEQLAEVFSKYNAIVFLCYETPEKFCHRHILCKYLNLCGVQCKEYQVDPRDVYGYNKNHTTNCIELF